MILQVSIFLLFSTLSSSLDERVTLHIAGTFPMESGSGGWAGGEACRPAVLMALEDVNNRLDIIPGYKLNINVSNSKCQPGLASQQLYDFLYTPPTKLMLLAGCSPVTTLIAEAAPVWNLVVISYGGSSPALSNRERFPTLFRTHPSANMQNPTRLSLFEKFNWKRISILQSVEEVFTSTSKDLEELCRKNNIRADRQSFYGDPTDAIKTLVRQDARIIVGLFYETEARKVLCQAYRHKLYGPRYVWVFIGWYADTWYIPPVEEHLRCTADEMRTAAQYHFTTESIMLAGKDVMSQTGMTGQEFQRRLNEKLVTDPANAGGYPEAPLAYDAVWALALAFKCAKERLPYGVKLEHFNYENGTISQTLYECVRNTSFIGVSGQVMFSDSGDRIAKTQIEQMQDGKYVLMGYYDSNKQELEWFDKEKWFTERGPPPDSTIIKKNLITVSRLLYYSVSLFALIGIGLAIAMCIYICRNSTRTIIVQSQPECNYILIGGCTLCLFSLIFLGFPPDNIRISNTVFSILCHTRLTILLYGFTLAYGSMFAKVWIVHRMGATENQQLALRQKDEPVEETPWDGIRTLISSMVGRQPMRKLSTQAGYDALLERRSTFLNQPIPASRFYWVVVAFLVLDTVITVIWVILDPLQKVEQKFAVILPNASEKAVLNNDIDTVIEPVLEQCRSSQQEIWIAVLLGYKCLLLIFGIFLSYECRNLKLRFVNDSHLIGLAIYNVAVLSLVTGPVVTLLTPGLADANFVFVSVTVLLCSYISLGLIFGPKIRHIHKVPPSADEVIANGNASDIAGRGNSITKPTMSKSELKRYELLKNENDYLDREIQEKDKRIRQCKERLEMLLQLSTSERAKLKDVPINNNNTTTTTSGFSGN
ncbi:hypothetical protein WR25_01521 isoform A [Diploscapter pachys]|uniref:G-protein coupled receptors family 3 profile domain-containing protein n=1 Tax=Diploscapter pachys TaxID=2018661 RepID=A0A2A2J262_9BILA|nr:hypothetical protein WR25_01521 isoform A [Diploscapter pachys]